MTPDYLAAAQGTAKPQSGVCVMHRPRCALFGCLVAILVLVGCATSQRNDPERAGMLAARLCALSGTVSPAEATNAAVTACESALRLARDYHVVRPAWFHNVLVNVGLRRRGLCYQWADDLTTDLERLHLKTLQIHRGVARLETRREHSCVVLTALGQAFEEGIALDAWRYCGRLHWSRVTQDKYPWIRVELE